MKDLNGMLKEIMFIRDDMNVVREMTEDDEYVAAKLDDLIKRVEKLAADIRETNNS